MEMDNEKLDEFLKQDLNTKLSVLFVRTEAYEKQMQDISETLKMIMEGQKIMSNTQRLFKQDLYERRVKNGC